MTTTPSAPLTVADLDDYGVNHYEDEHGECYWCCDEWPCFTHRLLSLARDALALRSAAQWLIDELQAPDDQYRLNEADKAMDAVIELLAAGRATAGTEEEQS